MSALPRPATAIGWAGSIDITCTSSQLKTGIANMCAVRSFFSYRFKCRRRKSGPEDAKTSAGMPEQKANLTAVSSQAMQQAVMHRGDERQLERTTAFSRDVRFVRRFAAEDRVCAIPEGETRNASRKE
jgi:hypothetical protein